MLHKMRNILNRFFEYIASSSLLSFNEINWDSMFYNLKYPKNPYIKYVLKFLNERSSSIIAKWKSGKAIYEFPAQEVLKGLNEIIKDKKFYNETVFSDLKIIPEGKKLIEKGIYNLRRHEIIRINRNLLESIFPESIAGSESMKPIWTARMFSPPKSPFSFDIYGDIEEGAIEISKIDDETIMISGTCKGLMDFCEIILNELKRMNVRYNDEFFMDGEIIFREEYGPFYLLTKNSIPAIVILCGKEDDKTIIYRNGIGYELVQIQFDMEPSIIIYGGKKGINRFFNALSRLLSSNKLKGKMLLNGIMIEDIPLLTDESIDIIIKVIDG